MKHIQTLETRNLCESAKNGGCGECNSKVQKTPPFLAAFFMYRCERIF